MDPDSDLPPYPEPPPDAGRLEDPATIARGIAYWGAVEAAGRGGEAGRARIAGALRRSYQAARQRLRAGPPIGRAAARRRTTNPRTEVS